MSDRQLAFIRQAARQKRIILGLRLLIFVLFIALWEISTKLEWIDSFIFSSPSRILFCFLEMAESHTIFYHVGCDSRGNLFQFFLVIVIGIFSQCCCGGTKPLPGYWSLILLC